jgi:NAD(P)-dependent dehydrogenase (short-subunit alcohol dehydrogenase family)
MRFKGKKVLVTGAGHGIGLAIAQAFTAEGARVAINDITTERIDRAREILGGNSCGFAGDVADADQAQSGCLKSRA